MTEEPQVENERLAKHILELQADKGRLIDELSEAKEIIRDFISVAIDYIDKEDKNYSLIVEAEAFINKE